jgi:hypothetical protein
METIRPITPQRLMELGFHLPGKEKPIPLITTPVEIKKYKLDELSMQLTHLTTAMIKAKAFNQETGDIDGGFLNQVSRYPFIWRFDLLLAGGNPQNLDFKVLELNATRPGGFWLVHKAAQVYREFGEQSILAPEIAQLGLYFYQLNKSIGGNGNVVLSFTPGYVAEIEMPQLAILLNKWASEGGLGLSFGSCSRNMINEDEGGLSDPNGRRISVFYENAGPEKLPDGSERSFLFLGDYPETKIINHPDIAQADNKGLMAVLFNPNFMQHLTEDEVSAIQALVPPTYLLDPDTLVSLVKNGQIADYFIKITDGLRGSSGMGVCDGQRLTPKEYYEIMTLMKKGQGFIIQERIRPDEPWLPVEVLQPDNRTVNHHCFADLDPYIFFDGKRISINGVLIRAKPEHPINVSQGGGLGCVKIT